MAVFDTINSFSALISGNYVYEYDYRDFTGYKCIPRLALSTGCKYKCRFCSVSSNLTEIDQWSIEQHMKSFRDLDFKLVYLNDKTFGQARNHSLLPELSKKLKALKDSDAALEDLNTFGGIPNIFKNARE